MKQSIIRWCIALLLALFAAPETLATAAYPLPEVHIEGDGDITVLMIPCMSCRWRSFEPLIAAMEESAPGRFRFVAVTIPGFGGNPIPNLPTATDTPIWHLNARDALADLVDELDTENIILVTHSWGAIIGMELIDVRSEQLGGWVMLDGNPFSDRSWFADDLAERADNAAGIWEQVAENYADPDAWQAFNMPTITDPDRRRLTHGWFMATPRDVVTHYWSENHLVDRNPMLARMSISVLDIKAQSSRVEDVAMYRADRHDAWRNNGAPPSVRTVFLEGATHHLQENEIARITPLIVEFMD